MELWLGAFGVARWLFDTLDAGTTDRKLEHTLIAEEDGKIVSAVDVFIREMRDEHGAPVKVGGIGSVATDPDHRKKGHSGQLLLNSIEMMKREGCSWSMLFTGYYGHYGRYGWVRTPWRRRVCAKRKAYEPTGGFEIEALGNTGPWPLEDMAQIYSEFNASRPLSHVRTKLYWETPIRVRLERSEKRTWIAHRQGIAVAYLVATIDSEGFEIAEVCFISGAEGAVSELLFVALGDYQGDVVVRLPWEPPIDGTLETLFWVVREEESFGPMVREIGGDWSVERIRAMTDIRNAHCWDLDNF